MRSPYGMELVENCLACKLCSEGFFCRLPKPVMEAFQSLKFTLAHPAGATLFVEGQICRGIYILCKGRVKLSATSKEGQTLILKVAQPGEVLGLNAAISGIPHETTAETGQPCQLNFVKRDDFLKFLKEHGAASMHAAIRLASEGYNVLTANSGEYGLKLFYSFPLYHSCPEHDALKWLRPPVEAIWPILSIPLPPSPVHQRAPSGQLSGARCRPTRSNTKVGLPSEH
jgi:hypothetical protein